MTASDKHLHLKWISVSILTVVNISSTQLKQPEGQKHDFSCWLEALNQMYIGGATLQKVYAVCQKNSRIKLMKSKKVSHNLWKVQQK